MPKNCSISWCFNNASKGVKLHYFPKAEHRKNIWVKQCGGNLKTLTYYSVLCDAHFTEDQFEQNRADGKKPLKWNAIPTIFNVVTTVKKIRIKKRRRTIKRITIFDVEAKVKRRIPLKDICENSPLVSERIKDQFEWPRYSVEPEHHENKTTIGEHFTSIAETLVKYKERGFLCDAILVAKCGNKLKAHSALLAAGSPFFMKKFVDSNSDGPHHLYFPDMEFEVLEIAVNFVYTGKLVIPSVYSVTGQRLELLDKLYDLGLSRPHDHETTSEKKLKSLGVTDAQITTDDDLSIDRSTVEHSYHRTGLKALYRKKNRPVYIKVTASAVNESEDVDDTDSPTDVDDFSADGPLDGYAQAKDSHTRREKSDLKNTESEYATCDGRNDLASCSSEPVSAENTKTLFVSNSQSYTQDGLQLVDDAGFIVADDYEHQVVVSQKRKDTFVCEFCPEHDRKEFNTIFKLLRHKTKCPWCKSRRCLHCERTFSSTTSLRTHIKGHMGIRQKKTKKTHVCDECGLILDTKSSFESHKRRHTGERPYQCNVCGRRFPIKSVLERHGRLHSECTKPFLCNFCGKAFHMKWSLQQHMNRHHDAEIKVHECAVCGCRLTSRIEMEKHVIEDHQQLTDSEDLNSVIVFPQIHLCVLCGKNFISASSLSRHIALHNARPIECDVCWKKLKTRHNLQIHKRMHTGERPFVCHVCEKGYMQKSALTKHLGTHTETNHDHQKPFKCTLCSKSFARLQYLRKHRQRRHIGEESYECNVCDGKFFTIGELSQHKRAHS